MSRLIAAAFASCVLALGCKQDAPEPKAEPKAAPRSVHAGAEQGQAPAAHGQQAPHASPHGASPHAAAAPLGPPRDVTPSGETREELVDGLKLAVPVEWTRTAGATQMRKAEFLLPGPGGDVQLVVYRFAGGAGGADKNIARWTGQVELAEGTEPQTAELELEGMKVTSVDLRGRFAGQSMPGAPPQPPVEHARLLAAAIMGPGDPFYFKLVGPAATVDVWADAWTKLLEGLAAAP